MATPNLFKKIEPVIKKAKTFVLTTHVNPDGDGLGSEMAMYLFLKAKGKKPRIINTSPVPKQFTWLGSAYETYEPAKHDKVIAKTDCLMVLDISVSKRLDRMQKAVLDTQATTICIDHHLDNDGFADYLCIDEKAPATAELIFNFIKHFKGKLNLKMAQSLYTSLLTDTGGFRFNATRPATHHIAAELLSLGVKPNEIYTTIFEQGNMNAMKLLGLALERLKAEANDAIHWTYIRLKDLADTGTNKNDTDGFVDYTLRLENSVIGVFAYETEDGNIKFSIRSKGAIDIQAYCKLHGGGGHRNASGLTMKEPFEPTLKKIIPELVEYYNKNYAKK